MINEAYEYRKFYNEYKNKINRKKVDLELAKENNKRYKSLEQDYNTVLDVQEELQQYVSLLEIFITACTTEDNAYRERRKEFMTSYIDENLHIIFPEEGFKSKLEFDYKYKSQVVSLTLVDKFGIERLPRLSEGMMLQQLISFSASIGLSECMGKNKIFMDEAFSASSPENLTKVGKLLEHLISKDLQIIVIEQKDDIYKDIPRREIHLIKDVLTDKVEISKCIDI